MPLVLHGGTGIPEEMIKKGHICAILYSNPNNPTWMCLTEDELKGLAQLADQYDVILIEDLAYFGMDFRRDISHPFEAPYQPSVSKYTENCLMMISGSKAFSYAGQRIGIIAMSNGIYRRKYAGLKARYGVDEFGNVTFCTYVFPSNVTFLTFCVPTYVG